MLKDFLPLVIFFAVMGGFTAVFLLMSDIFGPKKKSKVKGIPYESGKDPIGDARIRFSVKFYIIAMIFIIFDIEVVFMYPWAVVFKDMLKSGLFIVIEMFVFIVILLVGYFYIYKKGALDWE